MVKTEYSENKLPARLLAINEVANFLRVHANTIRRWVKEGLIMSYAIGPRHNLRFKQEDVIEFLNVCQRKHQANIAHDGGVEDSIALASNQFPEKSAKKQKVTIF